MEPIAAPELFLPKKKGKERQKCSSKEDNFELGIYFRKLIKLNVQDQLI